MTIHALIDGDWIMYAAGFAGQKNELVVDRGGKFFGPYKTMTEAREDLDTTDLKIYSRFILDEDSHFYHSVKKMIVGNCARIRKKFGEEVIPHVFIDGDGNFRNRVATIRPYKGTRSVHAKPLKYNDIREYLMKNWSPAVCHGQETDDDIALAQTSIAIEGGKSIIVSVDKDFLQVPGWHLNPKKGFRRVSKRAGLLTQYTQCLTGDSVDNIGGCWLIGPAAAARILDGATSEEDLWRRTRHEYRESVANCRGNDVLYGGLSGEDAAIENMRLIFLRRLPLQQWQPPEVV